MYIVNMIGSDESFDNQLYSARVDCETDNLWITRIEDILLGGFHEANIKRLFDGSMPTLGDIISITIGKLTDVDTSGYCASVAIINHKQYLELTKSVELSLDEILAIIHNLR